MFIKFKRKNIIKRIKQIAIYLIIAFLIYSSTYIIFVLFFHQNNTSSEACEEKLFFTNQFPEKYLWLDNNSILYIDNQKAYLYDIQLRKRQNLNGTFKNKIKSVQKSSNNLYFAQENRIIQTSSDFDVKTILSLDKFDYFLAESPFLCITYNKKIDKPGEIATQIDLFKYNNQHAAYDQINNIESTFSLKPLNCNPDVLYLIPSQQQLLVQLYKWEIAGNNTPSKITNPFADPIKQIAPTPIQDHIFLKSQKNQFAVFNTKTQLFKNDFYPIIDNYKSWKPYSTDNVLTLQNKLDPNMVVIDLITIDNSTRNDQITNQSKENNKKVKNLIKLKSTAEFIDFKPSPDSHNWALIAKDGELWIINNASSASQQINI